MLRHSTLKMCYWFIEIIALFRELFLPYLDEISFQEIVLVTQESSLATSVNRLLKIWFCRLTQESFFSLYYLIIFSSFEIIVGSYQTVCGCCYVRFILVLIFIAHP